MPKTPHLERHLGLFGATGVGVGAIVGGGILVLAGASFAVTGPSAILAFALNGVIAMLTALSFAEVSSKFPQSGGSYTFAKKVLSIEAAFAVGWVVWFASIVAAVLYALGFARFAAVAAVQLWEGYSGSSPAWMTGRWAVCGLAIAATLLYTMGLLRRSSGSGQWANVAKVAVFVMLIVFGLWALRDRTAADVRQSLQPFFAQGAVGLFEAMGFTFIALQGFDLIAAVAGEVRDPEKTLPRAMLASLGIALVIYLPLLFVVATADFPLNQSIADASRRNPATIVAIAADRFLGSFGYWLVVVGVILSTLTALRANLLAASRVALAMSRDRTLPRSMSRISERHKTPSVAVLVTAVIVVAGTVLLRNVSAAGAASSLAFLISFALVHWVTILVRARSVERPPPFRVPLFPLVPAIGGFSCLALAIYQGVAVPSAGTITAAWLSVGGLLFLGLFARRARIADASTAALDPELGRLRGRNPLVLVPIANPDNARGLVAVANALAPPEIGRVLLLSVVVAPDDWQPAANLGPLQNTQRVLGEAIRASVEMGLYPESLATVAPHPWQEIARVAKIHRCESLLLGLTHLDDETVDSPLDELMSEVDCDIVVLRAPKGWQLGEARRILIPTGGRGGHDRLLARLLSSISRSQERQITFLTVLPTGSPDKARRQSRRDLVGTAYDLDLPKAQVMVTMGESPPEEVIAQAERADLVILGVQRVGRRRKLFGRFALQVARRSNCPLLLISRRG
jgi:basic amino acid/polyamine antiporter, APA family